LFQYGGDGIAKAFAATVCDVVGGVPGSAFNAAVFGLIVAAKFRYMVEGVVKSSPYGLVYAKLGIIYVKTGNFC